MAAITSRGGQLALVQGLQAASGFLAQIFLLTRWSADEFLILNSAVVLIASLSLFGGLEMALPAAMERAADRRCLTCQTLSLTLLLGFAGMLTATVILMPSLGGVSMLFAAQIPLMALGSFGRGLLLAQNRLLALRLSLLTGSLNLGLMYAIFTGTPLILLPLITLVSTALTTSLAWYFADVRFTLISPFPLPCHLLSLLFALSIAGVIVNFQALLERLAVAPLGYVAALNAAGRGWDALLAVIVAASVLPFYPGWVQSTDKSSLYQSMRQTFILSTMIVTFTGICLLGFRPLLSVSLSQAAEVALFLLPRTFLLMTIQPLSLWFHARGQSWIPVIGSAVGVMILTIGIPLIETLPALTLITTLSVLAGWGILLWRVS